MSIDTLATFFGWCTVINVGFILIVVIFTIAADKDGFFFEKGAKLFGISKAEVRATHFRVFQQFRFAIVALNLVPYLALKIMA